MREGETRPGGRAMRGIVAGVGVEHSRARAMSDESPGSGWWVGEPQLWAGWTSRIRGEVSWMPLGIGFFGLRDAIGDWAW